MATYFMFGSYSPESVGKISSKRTADTQDMIEKFGGKLNSAYAILGDQDLVLIVDFPDTETAMKTSVALSKMLGIGFSTAPAVTVAEFDQLTEDL